MKLRTFALLAALAAAAPAVQADTIVFKNGDKLSGKITTMDGGKMKVATAVAGDVTVDMKDVSTFSTDAPLDIRTSDGKQLSAPAAAGDPDQIKAGDAVVPFSAIVKINPPAEVWKGSVVVNGAIARGNTNTDDLGVAATAELRRHDGVNDRTTLDGAYNLGRQKDPATGGKITTTDNWMARGKYDRFLDEKFYVYGLLSLEHDRIADLNYRAAPGVGVGYQWVDRPDMSFNTEAGLAYVYEDFIHSDSDDHIAARLAYHLTKKLNDTVSVFHNLEILPAFEDPGDYNLDTDAGIRADLTKSFFAEFKVELKRDSTPAEGAQKNDLRYVLGVGWKF